MMPWLFALVLACAPKPAPVAPSTPTPPPDLLGARPVIAAPVPWSPPAPQVAKIMNGGALWVVTASALPLVTVSVGVSGGAREDRPGAEGTAWLADRMLSQGAGKYDAAAFSAEVERLGVQLDVATTSDGSRITLSMRTDVVDRALDLLAIMIRSPRFTTGDFTRERGLAVAGLQQDLDDPPTVATRLATALWYGPGHPYAMPANGTVAGMTAVQLKDLRAYWKAAWGHGPQHVVVTGDITAERAGAVFDGRFGDMGRSAPAAASPPKPPAHSQEPIRIVDMPGAAQTMFYLVFPGVVASAPELPATRAGTIAFGGSFTSRLNALLREKKGYTYGAGALTQTRRLGGAQVIRTRIRTDATTEAMRDIASEVERIRAGITAEELVKARGAYRQDQVEAMETRSGMAAAFARYQDLGLGPDRLGADLVAMDAVTLEQVGAQMARYDLAHALIVLVGDRAVIEAPLTAAGFGPFVRAEAL